MLNLNAGVLVCFSQQRSFTIISITRTCRGNSDSNDWQGLMQVPDVYRAFFFFGLSFMRLQNKTDYYVFFVLF